MSSKRSAYSAFEHFLGWGCTWNDWLIRGGFPVFSVWCIFAGPILASFSLRCQMYPNIQSHSGWLAGSGKWHRKPHSWRLQKDDDSVSMEEARSSISSCQRTDLRGIRSWLTDGCLLAVWSCAAPETWGFFFFCIFKLPFKRTHQRLGIITQLVSSGLACMKPWIWPNTV